MKNLAVKCVLLLLLAWAAGPVWAGLTSTNNPNATSPCDSADGGNCQSSLGIPTYAFKSLLASLTIEDMPLSYTPPVGPAIDFILTYNAREANQPDTFHAVNLGPKWTLNWISYIQDDPNPPGRKVKRYVAGGGARVYEGYNPDTGAFDPAELNGAVLVRTSAHPIVYELRFSDGSKAVFAASNGGTHYPRRVFLSKRVDAQGNAVTLHYDSGLRLTAIADAIGQTSTVQYGNPAFPKRITDPFGRRTTFGYDSQGRLNAITDAIGMTSTFAYGKEGTFITRMTTPYGTTTFSQTREGSNHFAVQATGPLGYTERTEYRHNAPGIAFSAARQPSGMPVFNAYLNYCNAFYWNKTAYARACHRASDGTTLSCDYTQARIKHFLHNSDTSSQSARVLESIKYPLERRLWFTIPAS